MRSLPLHTTAAAAGVLAASLLAAPPAEATPNRPPTPPSASAPDDTTSRDTGASEPIGFGWWPYALASALAVSLAVPTTSRGGRRPVSNPVHGENGSSLRRPYGKLHM
ncbi:hypothetical protein ABZ016_25755 [Streptomyces sp. NPDC006372]|uniref:hypothetical protein n=1 Tax=Streptomyces sp. NPDC006372 TaxID=3155599 RepID=UPI0033BF5612